MKLTREQALMLLETSYDHELGLITESNELLGTSRWTEIRQLVARDRDGRLWASEYEQGLTENQDIVPWEGFYEIEFAEVRKVLVAVYRYERVDD